MIRLLDIVRIDAAVTEQPLQAVEVGGEAGFVHETSIGRASSARTVNPREEGTPAFSREVAP